MGTEDPSTDFSSIEKRSVGNDSCGNFSAASDKGNHLSDACMEGRFSRPRKGYGIRGHMMELFLKLFEYVLKRSKNLGMKGLHCCLSDLAIDAIIGARLCRNQIDPQGFSQPSRWDRTENIGHDAIAHSRPNTSRMDQRTLTSKSMVIRISLHRIVSISYLKSVYFLYLPMYRFQFPSSGPLPSSFPC